MEMVRSPAATEEDHKKTPGQSVPQLRSELVIPKYELNALLPKPTWLVILHVSKNFCGVKLPGI